MAYTSKTNEFRGDVAELIGVYRREGFNAASSRCAAIADARGLDRAERLTLADAFRRALILAA